MLSGGKGMEGFHMIVGDDWRRGEERRDEERRGERGGGLHIFRIFTNADATSSVFLVFIKWISLSSNQAENWGFALFATGGAWSS